MGRKGNVNAADARDAWQTITREIRGYWRDEGTGQDAWLAIPEVPSSDELMKPKTPLGSGLEEIWDEYKKDPVYDPNLPHNIIDGSWPSRGEYLESHFRLLREDTVAPLRAAIARFQKEPQMSEDHETRIYTHASLLHTIEVMC